MYEQAYKMLGGKIALMSNLDSSLDVIRKGLPIAMVDTAIKLLDMNKNQFPPLIGLNLRSLQRKKKVEEQRLTSIQSERTLMIIALLAQGEEYFGDRKSTIKWLNEPSIAFGQKAPIDMLDTVVGTEAVADTLNRLAYGMTA